MSSGFVFSLSFETDTLKAGFDGKLSAKVDISIKPRPL